MNLEKNYIANKCRYLRKLFHLKDDDPLNRYHITFDKEINYTSSPITGKIYFLVPNKKELEYINLKYKIYQIILNTDKIRISKTKKIFSGSIRISTHEKKNSSYSEEDLTQTSNQFPVLNNESDISKCHNHEETCNIEADLVQQLKTIPTSVSLQTVYFSVEISDNLFSEEQKLAKKHYYGIFLLKAQGEFQYTNLEKYYSSRNGTFLLHEPKNKQLFNKKLIKSYIVENVFLECFKLKSYAIQVDFDKRLYYVDDEIVLTVNDNVKKLFKSVSFHISASNPCTSCGNHKLHKVLCFNIISKHMPNGTMQVKFLPPIFESDKKVDIEKNQNIKSIIQKFYVTMKAYFDDNHVWCKKFRIKLLKNKNIYDERIVVDSLSKICEDFHRVERIYLEKLNKK
ncbi:hypothetical protein EDEG_03827 [Edhazardia aedis USNM 41457]|uniref:Uncharacterized protein n=1 Tax=Edhazardia aedis (strain USNM 41457) TaxID=1003232 RepID=J9D220_EDHAE|nr:hypothetical protein EDEG_03827 [Edhazardia aedis USNM 41457]|eukprot:EJW01624.1 hypothetical protein EDEG_03827 [Edhazardia aedis USNM 41457]